jgi:hypothetical protein
MLRKNFIASCILIGINTHDASVASNQDKAKQIKEKLKTFSSKRNKCILIEGDILEKYYSEKINSIEDFAIKFKYDLNVYKNVYILKKKYEDFADFPCMSHEEFLKSLTEINNFINKYLSWDGIHSVNDSWRKDFVINNKNLILKMIERPVRLSEMSMEESKLVQRIIMSEISINYYDIESISSELKNINNLLIKYQNIKNTEGYYAYIDKEKNTIYWPLLIKRFPKPDGELVEVPLPESINVKYLHISTTLGNLVSKLNQYTSGFEISVSNIVANRPIFAVGIDKCPVSEVIQALAILEDLKIRSESKKKILVTPPTPKVFHLGDFRNALISLMPSPFLRYTGFAEIEKGNESTIPGFFRPPMPRYKTTSQIISCVHSNLSEIYQKLDQKNIIEFSSLDNQKKCAVILGLLRNHLLSNLCEVGRQEFGKFFPSDDSAIFIKAVPNGPGTLVMEVHADVPGADSTLRMGFGGLPDPR